MAVANATIGGRPDLQPIYLPLANTPPSGLKFSDLLLMRQQGLDPLVFASESSAWDRLGAASGPQRSVFNTTKGIQPGAEQEFPGRFSRADTRWWTKLQEQLLCPLTRFPIRLLPYPPFKLLVDVTNPGPHFLVDGKFLAMKLIVDGHPGAGIRELEQSDILALDDYMQRCKLGPFRPGTANALQEEVRTAQKECDRIRAALELKKMQQKTSAELAKLRRIQDNRLSQIKTGQKAKLLPGPLAERQATGKFQQDAGSQIGPMRSGAYLAEDAFLSGIVGELELRGAHFAGRLQL